MEKGEKNKKIKKDCRWERETRGGIGGTSIYEPVGIIVRSLGLSYKYFWLCCTVLSPRLSIFRIAFDNTHLRIAALCFHSFTD
jgi:hypothetical protein